MKHYKYYSNIKQNAVFTNKQCQFCQTKVNCLEGVYFEQDEVVSICLSCLDKHRMSVDIPSYIQNRIKNNVIQKVEELKYTPPVPWVQFNDWQVCCDDYMNYIGEWEQEDFINHSSDGNGIHFLNQSLDHKTMKKVDDINVLWNDIGYNTVAYVFKCLLCGKITVVCQSY